MITEFQFLNFIPDDALRCEANLVLDHLLEIAPYGSSAVALLKEENGMYRCAVDIYSKHGPFIACVLRPTPALALKHVKDILGKKLKAWAENRFVPRLQNAKHTQSLSRHDRAS